jgi:hypothetical protein
MQHKTTINPALRDFDHLPDSALIRPKPSAQLLGVSIATLWRLIGAKKIPVNKLTERTTTIRVGDLRAFMAGKLGG